jgi:putative ABC transport system permease protein
MPGAESAAATSRLPLSAGNSTRSLVIPGLPPDVPAVADYRTASPGYFTTMGIPLLRGRAFEDADREGRPLVAVVSGSFATRYFPSRDPIGRRFSIGDLAVTIVGVVGDVHSAALDAPVQPTVYVPYRQDAFPFMTFVVRSAEASRADPARWSASLQASIQHAIADVDTEQPVGAVRTMDDQLSNSLSRRRFGVTLLTAFGAVAVLLAAVGLYGVLAFIVAQRRREIGVRIALGARPSNVVARILAQGMRLTAVGLAVGLVLALAVGRLMSSLLYGVGAMDTATFAGVAALLTVIAAAASVMPALRASRVDPLVALRDE